MFKKLSIIALILVGATGAYALVANLFPDTVSFPRIPMQAGTIGEVLGRLLGTTNIEGSDGTVANTLALSGVDANGYLHMETCTKPGEVWIGIDANGVPQCGVKGTILAFAVMTDTGTVGPIVVKHADNTTEDGYIGMMLNVGDMVSTPSGGSASIGFVADDSVVRLDADTSIEIQQGTLDGRTVAQVNLDQGLLWGRVLTSTGINFGGGGYIAGVRGTSIAMKNDKTDVFIQIPHSTNTTNDAVTITNTGISSGPTIFTGGVGTKLDNLHIMGPYFPIAAPVTASKSDSYDETKVPTFGDWIARNTKKDIIYMDILYDSGAVSTARKLVATGEIVVTLPPPNTTECTNLLTGATTLVDPEAKTIGLSTIESSVRTEICSKPISAKTVRCGSQGLVWWPNFNKCNPFAFAIADPSSFIYSISPVLTTAPSWSLRKQDKSYAPPVTADNINGKFEYDQIVIYNNLGDILGKKLQITLTNPIPVTGKYILLDMGSFYQTPAKYWRYYIQAGNKICVENNTTLGTTDCDAIFQVSGKTYTIKLPTTIGTTNYYSATSYHKFLIGSATDVFGTVMPSINNLGPTEQIKVIN